MPRIFFRLGKDDSLSKLSEVISGGNGTAGVRQNNGCEGTSSQVIRTEPTVHHACTSYGSWDLPASGIQRGGIYKFFRMDL